MINTHAVLRKNTCRALTYVAPWLLLLSGCSTTPPRNVELSPTPAIAVNHTPEPASVTADDRQEVPANQPTEHIDTSPDIGSPPSLGEEVAVRAIALVGKPYRYGGADLDGFDCSGLVFYIYHELGIDVPRSAAEQHRSAKHIKHDAMLPGDLVFFRIRHRIAHVGIYVGDNRFVHAPQTGKRIELRALDEKYFAHHLAGAGRVIQDSLPSAQD